MRKLVTIRIDPNVWQKARETGLNISKTCENSLKQEIQRLTNANPETNCISTCVSTSRAATLVRPPGFEPGSSAREAEVTWAAIRGDFIAYIQSKNCDARYQADMLHYLDKHVTVIREPMDVVRLFAEVKGGRRHLWLGLRNVFNYLEIAGFDATYLNRLRNALPKVKCGIDLNVPAEEDILDSLRRLKGIPVKYSVLYDLLLDSGLRLVEAVKVICESDDAERFNGFYRCEVGMFRGSKQAYYAHFTEHTQSLLHKANGEDLTARNASHYFDKYGFINPKYLRKFAFDKMIELEVPESVADFIQGRVPKKIGAKHYMVLARQAKKFYPRYAEYINQLRQKALN